MIFIFELVLTIAVFIDIDEGKLSIHVSEVFPINPLRRVQKEVNIKMLFIPILLHKDSFL